MEKKKLINPITMIRAPDKINEEYSSLVIKLGQLELEIAAINIAEANQEARREAIRDEKVQIVERTKALSQEMDEAQTEIKRKEDLKAKELPEIATGVIANGATELVEVQP